MAAVDLGASVTVAWPLSPTAGTITATVTQPDGTSFAGTVNVGQTNPATAQFVPTMAGRHLVRFASSGAAVGAYQDIADVWPLDQRFIISTQEAQDALSMGAGVDPNRLNDLRLYIAAATPVIEDIIGGPVVYGQYTVRFDGGKPSVVLPGTVQSIVQVTENGNILPSTGYVFDPTASTLTAGTIWAPRRFMPTVRGIVVTYNGGFQVIPPNLILATREEVRHLWQIGRQGVRPASSALSTATEFTPSGFAVPKRVIELANPQTNTTGGFA